MKVFFSHAYDDISREVILHEHETMQARLAKLDITLVNPTEANVDESAIEKYFIVDKELEQIGLADVLLADMSIPGWPYIGCICEIVYAYVQRIPVIIFTGQNEISQRLWLQYHSTYMCKTQDEAIRYLEGLLNSKSNTHPPKTSSE